MSALSPDVLTSDVVLNVRDSLYAYSRLPRELRNGVTDRLVEAAGELLAYVESVAGEAEDDWEYGIRFAEKRGEWVPTTRAHVEDVQRWHNGLYEFARRRRAGEWEPVEAEAAS